MAEKAKGDKYWKRAVNGMNNLTLTAEVYDALESTASGCFPQFGLVTVSQVVSSFKSVVSQASHDLWRIP